MPRRLPILACALAVAGCRPAESPVGELPRAGMRPILRVAKPDLRASSSATVERAAVLKTLEAEHEDYTKRWDGLTPEAAPSKYRETYREYLKKMRELDVKETSLEFRGAWNRYLEAWDKFLDELRATPDGLYKDVEFMEALHAAFGAGGKDANRGLSSDAIRAAEKLKETRTKLHSAAEAAGVNCHNT